MKRILVVEDDSDLRICLSEILRAEGFATLEAASGREAIGILEQDSDIDLVVTDYLMKNGNGMDVVKFVRGRHPAKPHVFLMTGQSAVDEEEARESGVQEFILKPFDIPGMISSIHAYLN